MNQLQAERLVRADVDTIARCPRGGDSQEIPPRVEELVEWMGCRQQKINDAVAYWRDSDVTRLAGALAEGAMQLLVDPVPVCCDEHGPLSARRHQKSRVVHDPLKVGT